MNIDRTRKAPRRSRRRAVLAGEPSPTVEPTKKATPKAPAKKATKKATPKPKPAEAVTDDD